MAEEIRAEIVANVAQISVREGDEVDHETTVVVLESMKMEIPVLPEGSGRITRIAVAPGDVVQEGDLIAVVE
ncbi:biotin/lipoyl-binding carrier protein [Saccharothrix sp. BKS2]|uniref:biotin/lipoyl-binding carrier protein n=1 Tax=Saccharothrix sp. BKS2 TaxID=3064400 RepID=UPI0039EB0883